VTDQDARGIESVGSPYPVEETLTRLEGVLRQAGLRIFARIDFSDDAQKAGLTMQPAHMLLFGSPKAGTPLMVAAPTLALDLPLKVLVWEDAEKRVWATYNSPAYLERRHGVPANLIPNISGVATLVRRAIGPA
jgi:uncharacterized protein (DUF302 family)